MLEKDVEEDQGSLSSPATLSLTELNPSLVLFPYVRSLFRLHSVLSIVYFNYASYAIKLENMAEATKLCRRLRRKFNIRNYLTLFFKKAKIRKKCFFRLLFLVT